MTYFYCIRLSFLTFFSIFLLSSFSFSCGWLLRIRLGFSFFLLCLLLFFKFTCSQTNRFLIVGDFHGDIGLFEIHLAIGQIPRRVFWKVRHHWPSYSQFLTYLLPYFPIVQSHFNILPTQIFIQPLGLILLP